MELQQRQKLDQLDVSCLSYHNDIIFCTKVGDELLKQTVLVVGSYKGLKLANIKTGLLDLDEDPLVHNHKLKLTNRIARIPQEGVITPDKFIYEFVDFPSDEKDLALIYRHIDNENNWQVDEISFSVLGLFTRQSAFPSSAQTAYGEGCKPHESPALRRVS